MSVNQIKKVIRVKKESNVIAPVVIKQEIIPIKLDCENLRKERQQDNYKKLSDAITNNNKVLINKYSNKEELPRLLDYLGLKDLDELITKCNNNEQNELTKKLVVRSLAIKAARQGLKDEAFVLSKINETTSKMDIKVSNLANNTFRPTKSGDLVNKNQFKELNLKKSDCLKSFDGQITGKVKGWIFAKITYSKGGFQDSVFHEADYYVEWIKKYEETEKKNDIYAIIIDTNLEKELNELKEKFKDLNNVFIGSHFEFQEYMIAKYNN